MTVLSISMGYAVSIIFSAGGCWVVASSVRRYRSPGIGGSSDSGPSDVDIAESTRPRAEFGDWVDERSQLRVNAESGRGWHIGVLPLDRRLDRDQPGTVAQPDRRPRSRARRSRRGLGKTRDLGYPRPLSRTRMRALGQDARRDGPGRAEGGSGACQAVKSARKRRPAPQAEENRSSVPRPVPAKAVGADRGRPRAGPHDLRRPG